MDKREIAASILHTASKIVSSERKNQHGDAENSFHMIAALWRAYLTGRPGEIDARDVAHMMALLKIARSVHGDASHADHYVDAAGYAALAGMLARVEMQRYTGVFDDPVGDLQHGKGHAPGIVWDDDISEEMLKRLEAGEAADAQIVENLQDRVNRLRVR